MSGRAESMRSRNAIAFSQGTPGYTRIAIVLHWLIAGLVCVNWPLGMVAGRTDGSISDTATDLHKPIGMLVLALTVVRIGWRMRHAPPTLPARMGTTLRFLARATHIVFYALLLAIPVSGWWVTSALAAHPVTLLLFDLPYLPVPRGMASASAAFEVHEILGYSMLLLVGLHVAAALKHHFIDRDSTLERMLGRQVGDQGDCQ